MKTEKEPCCHRPGNIRACQKLQEARKDPPRQVFQRKQGPTNTLSCNLQNLETLNVCLSHAVHGTLLGQPEQTNTTVGKVKAPEFITSLDGFISLKP